MQAIESTTLMHKMLGGQRYDEPAWLRCPNCLCEYSSIQLIYEPEINHQIIIDIKFDCGQNGYIIFDPFVDEFKKPKTAYKFFYESKERCKKEISYVYFLEAQGLDKIKIGVSKNPEARLKQLMTGSPSALKLLAYYPGNEIEEKTLHEQFSDCRHDGEWFHATKKLRVFIERLHYEQPPSRHARKV